MPNDQPKNTPQQPNRAEPIQVGELWFHEKIDLPGKEMTTHLAASEKQNRTQYKIELLPWLRFFRITCVPIKGAGEEQVRMVHESRAQWSPA